ncbi:hypothetical protein BDZ89DRAFT_1080727 [Hymenopellis radicata]|nr:hypothetical protein BDZ89DRAFT_1080727 [Hymenopellis radicata]
MAKDLREAYIPACTDCLRNKGTTTKPAGPHHPTPIFYDRGTSGIRPLPEDDGYNSIVTMTDRLGSDVRIIPTRTDITAEDFARAAFACVLSTFWQRGHRQQGPSDGTRVE